MLRSSIAFGRIFGVDVRVHLSFVLLLAACIFGAVGFSLSAFRGLGLWAALCFAVLVREIARAIAGAYTGLRLRALVLLPVGGVMAFESASASEKTDTKWISPAGPIGNLLIGLLMLGTCYAFLPGLRLFAQPWVTPTHVLRSFVWMQFILAVVGLLPSLGPSRFTTDNASAHRAGAVGVFTMGAGLGIAVAVLGLVTLNLWLIVIGAGLVLMSQMKNSPAQAMNSPESESICVREVMLTEYTTLNASDTLSDALSITKHSLQDVFPVLRGNLLVGSVSRATLAESLRQQGDGYLQGVMNRNVPTAAPEEKLVEALRRSATLGGSEFIPVVEDDGVLGILTPQSLTRAVQIVNSTRLQQQRANADE